jgi:site-specific DNA recombinase
MIAEYERAQILERSRRGKRHRARSGEVSVMSGAPYGYRYVRKSDEAPAAYAVIEAQAQVVQRVYELYTVTGLSIGAITRQLNTEGVATRKRSPRWERSVVWAMLRNSAYRGVAYFGKTRVATRSRVTRPLRLRGGISKRDSAGHERPREDWVAIPVPPLVSEESFARAQELLQENKIRARRRTITPSIVQGLVSCQKCGYAFSRVSTRTSARKLHYYKCIGSDSWRKLGGPVCDNGRLVRQDLLDQIVWDEVIRLLEDPTLIQQELDRRLAAARASDPTKQREQSVQRELTRIGKSIERMINAYQEELVSLEQLRDRMPPLRHREQTLRAELQAISDQTNDRATLLRLAETLTAFLARLRGAADTLDVIERQRIVRLVVKEVLVGHDSIVIRHSIPVASTPSPGGGPPTPRSPERTLGGQSYLLRKGSNHAALGNPHLSARLQDQLQQMQDVIVINPLRHFGEQHIVPHAVKIGLQIKINHLPLPPHDRVGDGTHRLMRCSLGSIPKRSGLEIRLEDRLHDELERALHDTVADTRDRQHSDLTASVLRYLLSPRSQRQVPPLNQFVLYLFKKDLHPLRLDGFERDPVNARCAAVRFRRRVRSLQRLPLADMNV